MTPLAPGSDFILAQAAVDWLGKQGIPHRLLVIQAITLDQVVADYQKHWEQEGSWDGLSNKQYQAIWENDSKAILNQLENFISHSPNCAAVVDLTLEGTTAQEENRVAYQRAARWIVQRAHELIAFNDTARSTKQLGGTAETLQDWQRQKMRPALMIS